MKKILGATLGTAVHIGGLYRFLKHVEAEGHHTHLLKKEMSVEQMERVIMNNQPDIIAYSYQNHTDSKDSILPRFTKSLLDYGYIEKKVISGGEYPVVAFAKRNGFSALFLDRMENEHKVVYATHEVLR
jgi:hypothetical protein